MLWACSKVTDTRVVMVSPSLRLCPKEPSRYRLLPPEDTEVRNSGNKGGWWGDENKPNVSHAVLGPKSNSSPNQTPCCRNFVLKLVEIGIMWLIPHSPSHTLPHEQPMAEGNRPRGLLCTVRGTGRCLLRYAFTHWINLDEVLPNFNKFYSLVFLLVF